MQAPQAGLTFEHPTTTDVEERPWLLRDVPVECQSAGVAERSVERCPLRGRSLHGIAAPTPVQRRPGPPLCDGTRAQSSAEFYEIVCFRGHHWEGTSFEPRTLPVASNEACTWSRAVNGLEFEGGRDDGCDGTYDRYCFVKTYDDDGYLLREGTDNDCDGVLDGLVVWTYSDDHGSARFERDITADGKPDSCQNIVYAPNGGTASVQNDPRCDGSLANCRETLFDESGGLIAQPEDADCDGVAERNCGGRRYDVEVEATASYLDDNCDGVPDRMCSWGFPTPLLTRRGFSSMTSVTAQRILARRRTTWPRNDAIAFVRRQDARDATLPAR